MGPAIWKVSAPVQKDGTLQVPVPKLPGSTSVSSFTGQRHQVTMSPLFVAPSMPKMRLIPPRPAKCRSQGIFRDHDPGPNWRRVAERLRVCT